MTCERLIELERAILKTGIRETFRGQAWSKNTRKWVYFDCVLSSDSIRQQFKLADCIKDHEHVGYHDGDETGLVCVLSIRMG